MRLFRVKLFYAFLLHFYSEGSEEEGRSTTASPHAGSATHGQAAAKASPHAGAAPASMACCSQPARATAAHSGVPAKGQVTGRHTQVAAASGQPARGCRSQPGCKGRPPTASLATCAGAATVATMT
ncbi:hypothetical protein BHE74_00027342 [Ensete ventricosum]|nr:hypothetical protein BHE74_00027342 [Ensete ventricosum]